MITLAERLRELDEGQAPFHERRYAMHKLWPELCAVVEAAETIAATSPGGDWFLAEVVGTASVATTSLARILDEEGL